MKNNFLHSSSASHPRFMKCVYEHRMHLLHLPSCVFLDVTSFVHEFPTGVSGAPLPGV